MSRINGLVQRLTFENALRLVRDSGYNLDETKLTQNTIRSEVLMSTNSSSLHCPILENDNQNGNAFSTERRLKLTDVFVLSELAVKVANPASAADAAFAVYSYANLTAFPTANTAASITGAYSNGYLSLLVDNQQTVPVIDLLRFYKAPQTQQAANADYTASAISLVDSQDGSEDGFYPIQPNWILTGNSNIDLQLKTIVGAVAVEADSRWIIELRGFLAQNASKMAS
jgi:hypothetical protein